MPNIKSDRPDETREFFVDLLGFEVAMDLGWVVTVASPDNRSAQVTIIGNDDPAAPGISVEVADVDAVHAKAVEQGLEIAYPLRDEEWGVRRFMLREPSGTIVNVVSPPLELSARYWRTMSEDYVELVRAFYEVWNGPNGPEEAIGFLSEDFEFVNPDNSVESGTRRGHAGWSQAMHSLDAAFHRYEHELGEITDLGDRVLCFTTFVARTAADSVAFRQDETQLWTLRDGKLIRLQWFHDRAEALEAAGLSD